MDSLYPFVLNVFHYNIEYTYYGKRIKFLCTFFCISEVLIVPLINVNSNNLNLIIYNNYYYLLTLCHGSDENHRYMIFFNFYVIYIILC